MSIFFDALKKAKSGQIEDLFDTKNKTTVPKISRYSFIPSQKPITEQVELLPVEEEVAKFSSLKPNSTFTKSEVSELVDTKKHHQITLPTNNVKLVALNINSPASEQFAVLRARLIAVSRKENIKTICITSSVKDEGKTFVAVNLALALAAESQQGVVIIDADLRRPSLHNYFGIKEATGLSDFLQSDRSNIDSLIIDTDKKLSCIPAGHIANNPLPLLDSEKMKWLISELSKRYDFVIIDTPPIAPLADADILASLSDGLIFVIKAGETPLMVIQRSLKMLSKHKILGITLNQTSEVTSYEYYDHNKTKSND